MEKFIEEYAKYAKKNNFKLNPNKKIVKVVIEGLIINEKKFGKRYCPCRRVSNDPEINEKIICPCAYHKREIEEDGHCHCLLFVK